MRFRALIALPFALYAGAAFPALWAYVDGEGRSHLANRQVDARYRLFFKGETTLDVPDVPARETTARGALVRRMADSAIGQRFERQIRSAARTNALDPALVKAVVAVESAFDPRAVSEKGAVGLMQVLPQTGERYGVHGDGRRSTTDKLFDPVVNLGVGTRYLRDLLARFANDLSLALAAYNAGEQSVITHDNRIPPFAETRDYVRLVRELYAAYRPPTPVTATPVRLVERRTNATTDRRAAASVNPSLAPSATLGTSN